METFEFGLTAFYIMVWPLPMGEQGAEHSRLNEIGYMIICLNAIGYMIICLKIWCPVGGTVWKGLGGVALLESMCH